MGRLKQCKDSEAVSLWSVAMGTEVKMALPTERYLRLRFYKRMKDHQGMLGREICGQCMRVQLCTACAERRGVQEAG